MSYIGNEPIVSATRTITEITATAGQTVFVANGGYTVGYIDVFVNGAQLQTSDFTASNGSSITLISPATTGDDIRLVAWGTFTTSSSYTQAQADALLATKLNTSTNVAFKNRIINGDMRIDQRNAGASVTSTTSNPYTVDRWQSVATVSSKYTIQQSSVAPSGFTNSLLVTSSAATSLAAGDVYCIGQKIEGFNTADLGFGASGASTITISFWVRSSLTGTFGACIANSAFDRGYPFTYTISVANTWEKKSVTITGDTTGTWLKSNGVGIVLWLGLGVGSSSSGTAGTWQASGYYSATGATSVVGTSGATFYLTGVQLEVGSSATPYDTMDYGRQLAQCQRYFQLLGGVVNNFGIQGYGLGSSNISYGYSWVVPMRATPTVSFPTMTNTNTTGIAANNPSYLGVLLIAVATNTGFVSTINASGGFGSVSSEL